MTNPNREGLTQAVDQIEAVYRQDGRRFLIAFGSALRTRKLYPLENEQVQRSFDELVAAARKLHQVDPTLEMQISDEFVFINKTRLRLGLEQYAALGHVISTFKNAGAGILVVDEAVSREEWQELISVLVDVTPHEDPHVYLDEILDDLERRKVAHISLARANESDQEMDAEERAREVAKRTYRQSVAVTQDVVNSVRMGRTANVRRMKRAVQGIVDQVLNNELSLVGLTAIRDYDEYTFTHSVNVCIFSVALGKRLRLGKQQLYDLGIAALLHDVGKSRVPIDLIKKSGALTDEEWRFMQSHPWYGVLAMFQIHKEGDVPYRGIVTAYEHHMKVDVTGYPKPVRRRTPSLFSKIVAVADGFDAATTRRSYQNPIQPDDVLREMYQNRRRGFDPVIVKELVNLVGMYPVGTCVILDTREVAIVQGRLPEHETLNRPVVRIVIDAEGNFVSPHPTVDLNEKTGAGRHRRSIARVADPTRFGIKPGDVLM